MSEPFIGQIQLFGFNFAPRGWAFCDGQLLAISSNTALFSLLGTTYGGDGRTTFGLPSLRGRVPVHVGSGPGLDTVTWGQKGGVNNSTLVANNLPSHNHPLLDNAADEDPNQTSPDGTALAHSSIYSSVTPDLRTEPGATGNSTGSSQVFTNMQPFIGIYYSIALVGVFPSRN